jgi:hypothetical protein
LTLNNGSPICHKEVLNSVSNDPDAHHDASILAAEDLDKWQSKANLRSSKPQPTPRSSGQQESPTSLIETSIQKELEINEDDISIFKRVVQQIIHSDKPLSDLSDDTLAAYQLALTEAAYAAAAKGKFRRDSVATNHSPSKQEDSCPGLIPDSSHASHYEPFSSNYELEDDSDYEVSLEDDAIIAAANADALANDAEAFYCQEFGFYFRPIAIGAEYTNGGYFDSPSPVLTSLIA